MDNILHNYKVNHPEFVEEAAAELSRMIRHYSDALDLLRELTIQLRETRNIMKELRQENTELRKMVEEARAIFYHVKNEDPLAWIAVDEWLAAHPIDE